MKTAVLFDLDGTVLHSKPGIFRSVAYALKKLDVPMPPEAELMGFLGPPLAEGFLTVCHVPKHQIEDAVRFYREYYNAGGKFEAEIYDGLREVLEVLKAQGKRCYITTSKPHIFARQILEHFSMVDRFDEIYGSELDGTRSRKSEVLAYCLKQQNLEADSAVLVGDRRFDVCGAKTMGMDCVGVLYGYGSKKELCEAGAAYIVKDAVELRHLLVSL